MHRVVMGRALFFKGWIRHKVHFIPFGFIELLCDPLLFGGFDQFPAGSDEVPVNKAFFGKGFVAENINDAVGFDVEGAKAAVFGH